MEWTLPISPILGLIVAIVALILSVFAYLITSGYWVDIDLWLYKKRLRIMTLLGMRRKG